MGFNRVKKINASDTWVCPSGVTRANVYLLGGANGGQGGSGGGGGATGTQNTTIASGGGGAGGGRGDNGAAGQWTVYRNVQVTPGNTYNIVVGAGGEGGVGGAGGAFVATAATNGNAGAAGSAGTQGARSSFGTLSNPVQSTPTATNRSGGGGGISAGGTASSDSASGGAGGAGGNVGNSVAGTAVGATSSDGFIPVPDSIGQASNATIKQSVVNPGAGTAGLGTVINGTACGAGGGGGCGRNVENIGTIVVHDFDPYVDPGFVNGAAAHVAGGNGGSPFLASLGKVADTVIVTGYNNYDLTVPSGHGFVVGDVVAFVPGVNAWLFNLAEAGSAVARVTAVAATTVTTDINIGMSATGTFIGTLRKILGAVKYSSVANNGSGKCRYTTIEDHKLITGQLIAIGGTDNNRECIWAVTATPTTTTFDTGATYVDTGRGCAILPSSRQVVSVIDNGGTCRIYFAQPMKNSQLRVGSKLAVSATSVSAYNTIHTITSFSNNSYVDTNISYTSNATGGFVAPADYAQTTAIANNGGTIRFTTSVAHSFQTGDWVFLYLPTLPISQGAGYWQITNVSDNTHFDTAAGWGGSEAGYAYLLDGWYINGGPMLSGHPFACRDSILSCYCGNSSSFVTVGYIYDQTSAGSLTTYLLNQNNQVYWWPIFKGRLITSVADNGKGRARLTTASAHNILAGANVYVTGMTVTAYNGTWRAEAVDATTIDIAAVYSTDDSGGAVCGGINWGWNTTTGTRGWSVLSGLHGALGDYASAQPANSGFGGLGSGGGGGGGGGPGLNSQSLGIQVGQWGWAGKGGNGGKGGTGGSGFCLITWYTA